MTWILKYFSGVGLNLPLPFPRDCIKEQPRSKSGLLLYVETGHLYHPLKRPVLLGHWNLHKSQQKMHIAKNYYTEGRHLKETLVTSGLNIYLNSMV